jgi:hypothetical protein
MNVTLSILGVTVLDLHISAGQDDEEHQHLEDHTGYAVGFVSPPAVPHALDMPPREL